MATGVVAALDAVGLKIPVSGQDGDTAALNRVALGTQAVSVWKNAFALGETAGSIAMQLCAGTKMTDVKAPSDLPAAAAPASLKRDTRSQTPERQHGPTRSSSPRRRSPRTTSRMSLTPAGSTKEQVCANVAAGTVPAVCG